MAQQNEILKSGKLKHIQINRLQKSGGAKNRVVSLIFRDELVKPRLVGVSFHSIKYACQGYKNGLEHTLLSQQELPLLRHPI